MNIILLFSGNVTLGKSTRITSTQLSAFPTQNFEIIALIIWIRMTRRLTKRILLFELVFFLFIKVDIVWAVIHILILYLLVDELLGVIILFIFASHLLFFGPHLWHWICGNLIVA